MPDLLLELFSEEIPARMQQAALDRLQRNLLRLLGDARLTYGETKGFVTPRRVAIHIADIPEKQPDVSEERRGPKVGAPQRAIEGFLGSVGMTLEQLEKRPKGKDEFYFAVIERKGQPTSDLLQSGIEEILGNFHWEKSMRWGAHNISWVRPLQNILCVFGTEVLPVKFGHLTANNYSFGHRFMAPEKIEITDAAQYEAALEQAYVIPDFTRRRAMITEEMEKLVAAKEGLTVRKDGALLDEVTGLVEWPVVLMGNIDEQFMDLPCEVLISEMRHHQKYFVLEEKQASPSPEPSPPLGEREQIAPHFIITSNLVASDGGKAIIDGNERVLRARLEDARFFWDSDRKKPLTKWAKELGGIIFHAKLGTIADKVERTGKLAALLADKYISGADGEKVRRAAQLCKADLATGMVGEFPELQGIMGEYYALAQGEDREVAQAIREHYQPQGAGDDIPVSAVGTALALADKLDTICSMFAIDEKPTGSKDPFALRRAALGVIRIIRENKLRVNLREILQTDSLIAFFADRLKVQLKDEGIRPDVIDAIFATDDDDLVRVVARARAVQEFLKTEDGKNLLAAYNRASSILAKEEKKDGAVYSGAVVADKLPATEEQELFAIFGKTTRQVTQYLQAEDFTAAMSELAKLRIAVDAFFDNVMVNDENPDLRKNRLNLLAMLRLTMDSVADFSRIQQSGDERKKAA